MALSSSIAGGSIAVKLTNSKFSSNYHSADTYDEIETEYLI